MLVDCLLTRHLSSLLNESLGSLSLDDLHPTTSFNFSRPLDEARNKTRKQQHLHDQNPDNKPLESNLPIILQLENTSPETQQRRECGTERCKKEDGRREIRTGSTWGRGGRGREHRDDVLFREEDWGLVDEVGQGVRDDCYNLVVGWSPLLSSEHSRPGRFERKSAAARRDEKFEISAKFVRIRFLPFDSRILGKETIYHTAWYHGIVCRNEER